MGLFCPTLRIKEVKVATPYKIEGLTPVDLDPDDELQFQLELRRAVQAVVDRYDPRLRAPVEELGLSAHAANVLRRGGVKHLHQLVQMSRQDLGRIRGIGDATASAIAASLRQRGLSLRV